MKYRGFRLKSNYSLRTLENLKVTFAAALTSNHSRLYGMSVRANNNATATATAMQLRMVLNILYVCTYSYV